jgi:phage tail-like protein
MSYQVKRAWVSEYQALPEFDAGTTNTVGIQTIKLEHEGWDRDEAVSEPTES